MQTIRSFIAIPLTPEISRATTRLIKRLRDVTNDIKWVPLDNLHLTLKFLGDVDNTEVPKICEIIRDICASQQPFGLRFAGTGGFPQLEKPRILYVGIEDPSGSLVQIVSQLESRLATMGFKQEARDYKPHLTIGRSRNSRKAGEEIIHTLNREPDVVLGEMEVDMLQLMASFLDKSGPSYQVMDKIEF